MNFEYIISLGVFAITIIGFIYGILRNFKMDINSHIDKVEKRIDERFAISDERFAIYDKRFDAYEERLSIQDDRIEKQNMRLDGIYTILLNNSKK